MICEVLGTNGYKVLVARDSAEALLRKLRALLGNS